MTTVTAQLKFLRASPRKVKLVIDMVRGLSYERALEQLSVMRQGQAKPVKKLLESAAANAKSKFELAASKLWVSKIEVGQGPRLKRWTPRAMGRATPILRPTCHIRVVLTDVASQKTKDSTKKVVPSKA